MFNVIIDIFSRAQQNKALTPNERAIVKAVKGALYGVLINLLPQLYAMSVNHQSFNITQAGISALVGAFILALLKLWSAQNDTTLGPILDALAQQKEKEILDSLSSSASPVGTIPAWQFTIPAIQAAAIKTVLPISNQTVMNPVPPRASKTPPTSTGAFQPPLYTLSLPQAPTLVMPVPNSTSAPVQFSRLSMPPDPHDQPTDVTPAVTIANPLQA